MCQKLEKRVHQQSVKCYRVYQKLSDGTLISYYEQNPAPEMGVPTIKQNNMPFHCFRSKKDVKTWHNCTGLSRDSYVVVECVLSKRLKSGVWSDNSSVKTVTGHVLTIVREVATYKPVHYFVPGRTTIKSEAKWNA
jgi:hypothetical protein